MITCDYRACGLPLLTDSRQACQSAQRLLTDKASHLSSSSCTVSGLMQQQQLEALMADALNGVACPCPLTLFSRVTQNTALVKNATSTNHVNHLVSCSMLQEQQHMCKVSTLPGTSCLSQLKPLPGQQCQMVPLTCCGACRTSCTSTCGTCGVDCVLPACHEQYTQDPLPCNSLLLLAMVQRHL
jgi:hypothetical protein